jgi:hypothetical protein
MKRDVSTRFMRLVFVPMLAVITACGMYEDMEALKQPRYEIGEHKGAAFCGECHPVIYEQWSKNSRHAVATTA